MFGYSLSLQQSQNYHQMKVPYFKPKPTSQTQILLSLRLRPISISVSAASTPTPSSIQVDKSPVSATPSKLLPFRIGHGFDLHRLEPGYPLIIGGINVPHNRGCEAHSDGDVLLHCVVDAILGALGLPDIGQIFPDSDPKWKGCASSVFIHEFVSNICLPFSSLSISHTTFGYFYCTIVDFNSIPVFNG